MKDPVNRDALIKIAMDAMRIDAQLADVMITSTLADFASNMRLDGLKNAEEALLKTGLISKKVNVEAFYCPGSLYPFLDVKLRVAVHPSAKRDKLSVID